MNTHVQLTDVSSRSVTLCGLDDLIENAGVCAIYGEEQVAIFYLPHQEKKVFALNNWDPFSAANVLSRGIVGDLNGRLVVASPMYKQHFDLSNGECLEDEAVRVASYDVSVLNGKVVLHPRSVSSKNLSE